MRIRHGKQTTAKMGVYCIAIKSAKFHGDYGMATIVADLFDFNTCTDVRRKQIVEEKF